MIDHKYWYYRFNFCFSFDFPILISYTLFYLTQLHDKEYITFSIKYINYEVKQKCDIICNYYQ